ncbi:MAG: glycosyltransferase family 9 protein [Selenomonadaceae bacterium]|nr:glycosyltransferase family 9 protein [Selenomonadaceae bacterium]
MKNILVVKLSAIGDVIHALPVSHAIKETFPEAHLTWVVEPPAYGLLEANPCIDELLVFKKKEFRTLGGFLKNFSPFRRRLQQRHYDASLDLQGLFKSAAVIYFGKADLRLGTCNMREFSDRVSRPVMGPNAQGHIVERYLDVARALGCRVDRVVFPLEIPQRDVDIARKIMIQAGGRMENPYAVLAVGANWPNKRWPAKYYAELSDWLYERSIIPVIVGGGAVEGQMAEEISALAEIPPVNLVGRTSLLQLAFLVQRAHVVLGGDTGPVHLAAGLGTKTVMVMGPTDAKRNGPYGQLENALEVDRPCRYCWKRACPKGFDCLENISVRRVEEKLGALL